MSSASGSLINAPIANASRSQPARSQPPRTNAGRLAATNAAVAKLAVATALGHRALVEPDLIAVDGRTGCREHTVAVPLARMERSRLAGRLAAFYGDTEFVVQDFCGLGDLRPAGYRRVQAMPVLVRPPGPPPPAAAEPVTSGAALVGWERTVIAGFPFPELRGAAPGALLAPRALHAPGLHLLLRAEHGRPVAAVLAFHDGRSLGVYCLATLPHRRRRGHGGALTAAAVALAPAAPAVLCATPDGLPIYRRLGFELVAETTWWVRPRL